MSAVSDYGAHLRSHTAILKSMSEASTSLAAVVVELHRTLAASREAPGPVPPGARTPPPPPRALRSQLEDYLRDSAYAEWSLLVPELAARRLETTRDEVIRAAAAMPDVDLSYAAIGDVTIYRYRLRG